MPKYLATEAQQVHRNRGEFYGTTTRNALSIIDDPPASR
jgi:hypothetical protein